MDVKDYCGAMSTELTAWKAKMYDVTRRLDKLGTAEREKILPRYQHSLCSPSPWLLPEPSSGSPGGIPRTGFRLTYKRRI